MIPSAFSVTAEDGREFARIIYPGIVDIDSVHYIKMFHLKSNKGRNCSTSSWAGGN